MTERTHINNSRTTKAVIALAVAALLVIGIVLYFRARNLQEGGRVPPTSQLSVEQKYDVLGAVGSSSAANSGVGTSSEEGKKKTMVRAVSQTSATSTQSDSDKLKILRSLHQ